MTHEPPGGTAMLAGRPVARIGFGAMQLPGPGVWGPPRDRRPELTAERQRNGWHHTADLGRREADGSISFLVLWAA